MIGKQEFFTYQSISGLSEYLEQSGMFYGITLMPRDYAGSMLQIK